MNTDILKSAGVRLSPVLLHWLYFVECVWFLLCRDPSTPHHTSHLTTTFFKIYLVVYKVHWDKRVGENSLDFLWQIFNTKHDNIVPFVILFHAS